MTMWEELINGKFRKWIGVLADTTYIYWFTENNFKIRFVHDNPKDWKKYFEWEQLL